MRYDASIPAGAKLLYAEISALTDQRGYCYASNRYFAELYGVGVRTVQRYLDALKNAGLIRIADGEGGSDQRKIFAGINPLAAEPATEMSPPHDKNVMGPATIMSCPHDKNVTDYYNVIIKKEIKKEEQRPPISPAAAKKTKPPLEAELLARVENYACDDLALRDALIGFAEMRAKRKKPISTQRTMTLLLSRLNELSGGSRKAKLAIIEKATISGWLSFYPLRDDEDPRDTLPIDTGGRSVSAPEVARW